MEWVNNLLFLFYKISSSGYGWTNFYVYFIPLIFFSFEMGQQFFCFYSQIFSKKISFGMVVKLFGMIMVYNLFFFPFNLFFFENWWIIEWRIYILFVQTLSPFERVNILLLFLWTSICKKETLKMYHVYTFFLPLQPPSPLGKDGPLNCLPSSTPYFLASPKTHTILTIVSMKMEIIHVCVGPFQLAYCPLPILDMYHFMFTLSMLR